MNKNVKLLGAIGALLLVSSLVSLQVFVQDSKTPVMYEAVATNSIGFTDDERAMSFIVQLEDAFRSDDKLTLYTFSSFQPATSRYNTESNIWVNYHSDTPGFLLESLPSTDKTPLYDKVGVEPKPKFNASIKVVSGNGDTIQTWNYEDCVIDDYFVWLHEDKEYHTYSGKEGPEIREVFVFSCAEGLLR